MSIIRPAHFLLACTIGAGAFGQAKIEPLPPIISDKEFEEAIPKLDESNVEGQNAQTEPAFDFPQEVADAADFDDPLEPLESYTADADLGNGDSSPAETDDPVRYSARVEGITAEGENAAIFDRIAKRFRELSALGTNENSADSRAIISARASTDRQLLSDLLLSEGFYDATVEISAKRPDVAGAVIPIALRVQPGKRYRLATIAFDASDPASEPLMRENFLPKPGDPIVADEILAAEAQISLALAQNGYPFAQLGQRDILLDEELLTGDYNLPVATGAKSYFGKIRTEGNLAFDAEHVAVLRRFKTGDLYDARKVDDLREALVATGLLATVSVEPVAGEGVAADGQAYADLLVRQEAGPPRTISATAGYETGRGFRAEGSWTHRNMFPPEGSLSVSGILGTQEQALGVIFNRSNAGKRDRTIELSLSALHKNYDAYDAYTGRFAGTLSYQSTPIWQKELTYALGFELLATYESLFEFSRLARDRQLYYIAALPVQLGFDRSDDLLNPSRGFRVNARLSPEASLGNGSRFYMRALLDGSYYQPFGDSLVVAFRGRLGSIAGTARDSLAPSRRYYGGGGGSVRGFGYQQLGPKDLEGNPIGGRSLNEAAAEVRYRFGNFGAVAFVDAGQVYESKLPRFDDWRFGVGVGGRFYTNFGPVRVDVATPINRRPGESRFSFYVSLGQAF
ncbi:MAG TPA: BamA/TamA family outer membrane protein, partial [Sphingorhabdus sp.]|nr:BamA/TamA family outer membrane protein [Sphingorhabdus sp.]